MNFQCHADAVIAISALRKHAEGLRRFLFGRFDRHIKDIQVTITDHANRYGGKELCCQVEVILNNHVSIITRHTDADPQQAMKSAFAKAARTIAQRLRQRRLHNRLKPRLATT